MFSGHSKHEPVDIADDEAAAAPSSEELAAVRAELAVVASERDALREMCDGLGAELRDARLREASLRRMISLALEETIPVATQVDGASFSHAPAQP